MRHARHMFVVVSQMGRVPEQSVLATHSTQALVAVSHTCCATAQAPGLPAPHGTHAPLAPHTGADTSHSLSSAQVRQACVVPSQTGVAPEQSADDTHATHTPSVASHSAVAPEHAAAFVVEHAPHAPLGSHAAVVPPHSPSASQPRHTCVTPSQTGLVAVVHALAARQATHVPPVVSHNGVAPLQAVAFVVEHAPHAPLGWHAAVAPLQSVSPAHARHVFVPVSHTGFVPPH
ncbi:MAG TPA: hypothetical protein VH560_09855 [Polyangia bacterium]|nr:hypothetical protein [Polyangia bacterium]